MSQVNMLEAKSNLSKLVEAVESGKEREIVLARNGKPVARIVPMAEPDRQLGLGRGEFGVLDEKWFKEFQGLDEPIREAFEARLKKLPAFKSPKTKRST
jgi:prevent-host-death family protein